MLQVRDPNVLGNLGILNLKMPANGFFYVYTNNESNVKVYFIDLTIAHITSVLKEENHFYPYGLLMEGITPVVAANGSINKYKFSDSELQLELGLNQYDFSARFYDPVIGRFNVIDPFADFAASFTSYRYAFDNPVSYNDPSGLWEENETGDNDDESDHNGGFNLLRDYYHSNYNYEEEENYKNKPNDEFNDREETAFEELLNENSENENSQEDSDKEEDKNIIYQRTNETRESTTGKFSISGTNISGYFLEPAGPSTTTPDLDRRIPAGTYKLTLNVGKKAGLRLYNSQVPFKRAILIHRGNSPDDTKGCLLPGCTLTTDWV